MKEVIKSILYSFTNEGEQTINLAALIKEHKVSFIEFCDLVYIDHRDIYSFYSVKSKELCLKCPILNLNKVNKYTIIEKSIGFVSPSIMEYFQLPQFTKIALYRIDSPTSIGYNAELKLIWFKINEKYKFLILNYIK